MRRPRIAHLLIPALAIALVPGLRATAQPANPSAAPASRATVVPAVGGMPLPVPAGPNQAGADSAASQIRAAVENAVERLHSDIASEHLTPALTVGEFLDRTQGQAQLLELLQHADQIGGPRWIDSQTCQVKLAVPGERVAQVLVKIATDAGGKSPLPAEAVATSLRGWETRTYVETGSSIAAAGAETLKPSESNRAWRQVDDPARRRAVAAAKKNAIERAMDSLRPIPLSRDQIVGDALADPSVGESVSRWLASRPVTQVQFRPDLTVELTLSISPDELIDALRGAVHGKPAEATLRDPSTVQRLRQQVSQRVVPAMGRASAVASPEARSGPGAANPTSPPPPQGQPAMIPMIQRAVTLPARPPQWVRATPLVAEATAPPGPSKLKTARAAELAALTNLRRQVDALSLDGSGGASSLGDAARRSYGIAGALDSAMRSAQVYKIDYLADGSVTVKVSLDPRDVWDALRELP